MRISVKRSGGFAGLTEDLGAIDTAQLDATTRQRIEQMVYSMGFFTLPAIAPGGGVGADLFTYQITVSEGGQQHAVTFTEDDSPTIAALRALVNAVTHV